MVKLQEHFQVKPINCGQLGNAERNIKWQCLFGKLPGPSRQYYILNWTFIYSFTMNIQVRKTTEKNNWSWIFHCSSLFCSGVVMAEKDKCGKFWPQLGFVSAQLSTPGGWKACCEIWKSRGGGPGNLEILQNFGWELENLTTKCVKPSFGLGRVKMEWGASQLQPIEIFFASPDSWPQFAGSATAPASTWLNIKRCILRRLRPLSV